MRFMEHIAQYSSAREWQSPLQNTSESLAFKKWGTPTNGKFLHEANPTSHHYLKPQ